MTRVCRLVISIHCFGLVVTSHKVYLFAPTVAALGLRVLTCHTLLAVIICCFSVYQLGIWAKVIVSLFNLTLYIYSGNTLRMHLNFYIPFLKYFPKKQLARWLSALYLLPIILSCHNHQTAKDFILWIYFNVSFRFISRQCENWFNACSQLVISITPSNLYKKHTLYWQQFKTYHCL